MTLKKNDSRILSYFKDEIDKTNLTDQTKFRLNEMRLKIILTSKLIKEKDAVKNQVNILLLLIT